MNSIRKRSNEVDIIRMAALVGICIVNVPFMGLPVESLFNVPDGFHNKFAAFFVECFFQLKFFILFSFIFGWGMAIQRQSATSKGQPFAKRYFRRMLGLAVLGIAHATLVFSGDILVLYAFLGLFLWLIKDFTPRNLLRVSAWMVPLSMLFLSILAIAIDSMMADKSISATAVDNAGLGGSFFEATRARFTDWPVTLVFLFLLQGPLAFGAFAAGLAAAKSNFFSHKSDGFTFLEKRVPLLLIIALPLNILYAAVVGGIVPETYEILSLLGFVLVAMGAPALSLVYLYFFICLSRKIKIPQLLVLAGQNSLSSYVAQGALAGIVFGAYGFGLFNTLGHASLILLSLIIAFLAMLLVGLYAKVFGRGPLEPIFRKISGS